MEALPGNKSPTAEGAATSDAPVMSLMEHLDELRRRLFRSCATILVLFLIGMAYSHEMISYLKQPLVAALPQGANNLHFTGPLDGFTAQVKVAFLASILFGCPIWIYQFWRFVQPGLYDHERRYVFPFIAASILLFFSGVAFCYFLILPMSLDFLMTMGMELGTPIITINDYLSLLIMFMLAFGLIFETPVILILLAVMGVVSAEGLASQRRIVLVGVLIAAAILTPPDPLSQIAMSIPLYAMYELSIVLIRFIKPRPNRGAA